MRLADEGYPPTFAVLLYEILVLRVYDFPLELATAGRATDLHLLSNHQLSPLLHHRGHEAIRWRTTVAGAWTSRVGRSRKT